MGTEERVRALDTLGRERVLILDGAMGTQIQDIGLDEAGYRGTRFADWPGAIKGNNDILNLTAPDAVKAIHKAYFEAGADIVETNTFSATSIAQADYDMQDLAPEIAREGARLAVRRRTRWRPRPGRRAALPVRSARPTRPFPSRRT